MTDAAYVWPTLEDLAQQFGKLLPQDEFGGTRHMITMPGRDAPQPSQLIFPTDRHDFEFHTDGSYLPIGSAPSYIILYCLVPALSGGENLLLSTDKLTEWMRSHRPESYELLRSEVPFLVDQSLAGAPATSTLLAPAFWSVGASNYARIHRWRIAQAGGDDPQLMNALSDVGNAFAALGPTVSYRLCAEELLLLNNRRVLHARTSYHDGDTAANTRTLLRLWISLYAVRPPNRRRRISRCTEAP
jgi:alpha-ketoglutarate-dependent taurine dioxygenase